MTDRHLSAADIARILNVGLTQAYEIIHQCEPSGCVIRTNRTLRVSESGFIHWYAEHITDQEIRKLKLQQIYAEQCRTEKRRPGRPRKEAADNG